MNPAPNNESPRCIQHHYHAFIEYLESGQVFRNMFRSGRFTDLIVSLTELYQAPITPHIMSAIRTRLNRKRCVSCVWLDSSQGVDVYREVRVVWSGRLLCDGKVLLVILQMIHLFVWTQKCRYLFSGQEEQNALVEWLYRPNDVLSVSITGMNLPSLYQPYLVFYSFEAAVQYLTSLLLV